MKKSDLLDQLYDEGYVSKEVDVIPGKRTVVLTNLRASDQLDIEKNISRNEGNAVYTVHNYTMRVLASTIKEWDGEDISKEEAFKKVQDLPSRLVDKLVEEQRQLENELSDALGVENIQENFSRTGDLQPDSEQKQEE